MISKSRLKELTAYRLQKRCDEEAVFVVEGPKMCAEALRSGFTVRVLCAVDEGPWRTQCEERGVECLQVSPAELERLSAMRSPNGVWMLVERKALKDLKDPKDLKDLKDPKDPKDPPSPTPKNILALDRIQDPGNLGTILRTADWYGVRHVVCSPDTAGCYNPKVVQASMGAIFRTRVEYTDLPQWLAGCGLPVYGATLGGTPLPQVGLPQGGSVLVIGNESRGISPATMERVTHPVMIPNRGGTAESLNASVAAGILMERLWNN